jgi:polyisoprenoid-binding protein YceI
MKKNIIASLLFITASAFVITSCGDSATKSEDAKDVATNASDTFKVDVASSAISWRGFKKVGLGEHQGTIAISDGFIGTTANAVTSGNFGIDMNSIVCTDTALPAEYNAKLIGHLKSDDFFNVEKFPGAKFAITSVSNDTIAGNLTIRDVEKNIKFPAKISVNGNELTAEGSVVINRYEWNINYDKDNSTLSEKATAKLKNGLLSENIEIGLKIKATK